MGSGIWPSSTLEMETRCTRGRPVEQIGDDPSTVVELVGHRRGQCAWRKDPNAIQQSDDSPAHAAGWGLIIHWRILDGGPITSSLFGRELPGGSPCQSAMRESFGLDPVGRARAIGDPISRRWVIVATLAIESVEDRQHLEILGSSSGFLGSNHVA